MKYLTVPLLAAIIFLSGCQTYLGREKINMASQNQYEEIGSEIRDTFWQYVIADGKITLTHSAVRAVSYKKTRTYPYYYREKYLDFPLKKYSMWAYCMVDLSQKMNDSKIGATIVMFLLPPAWLCLLPDPVIWCVRWLQYPALALENSWHLDQPEGPGLLYRLAYLPVIANCNVFMLPPYLANKEDYSKYVTYSRSKAYSKTEESILIKEKEEGVEVGPSRTLYVNNHAVSLDKMPKGEMTVNLRKKELIPYLLPPQNVHLKVVNDRKKVIDLQIKTTDLISGEYLTMWNIITNNKENYHTRFSALNKLLELKVLSDEDYAAMRKKIMED